MFLTLIDRHWRYQLWLQISDRFPVFLASENKLSFVYREDVVSAIEAVIQSPETKVLGQAFNIAQVSDHSFPSC
jgi:nucleoside-diphosphate-sugar epimerase